ncbi:hypothetical protein A9G13_07420 [Gilliamella sp. wkB178]|uniref:hypothetical protein n=1 Tax=Gilliamella sp. wkB178 TaxID=3120259 RepID=UPI00080E62EB|nr:hypothetical protein [Gilliamella apicola]OCG08020.1 hypothetical protein A9G13_07420 [Gilliamella apicola]
MNNLISMMKNMANNSQYTIDIVVFFNANNIRITMKDVIIDRFKDNDYNIIVHKNGYNPCSANVMDSIYGGDLRNQIEKRLVSPDVTDFNVSVISG